MISFLSQPWRVTCAAVSLFGEIEGEQRAASFAYYALFSLFPLFALLLTVGSVFVDPVSAISAAEKIFPMADQLLAKNYRLMVFTPWISFKICS